MQSSRPNPLHKAGPRELAKVGLRLGVVMVLIGYIWVDVIRGENALWVWFSAEPLTAMIDVSLGLIMGALAASLVAIVGHRLEGFRRIRDLLMQRLDMAQFRWWDCAWLAILAALPEEIIFRGAMQPAFGLAVTAVIFGLLHSVTVLYLFYAIAAGFLLGGLYEYHQTLWMPIAAHFAVDYLSLIWLSNWARQQQPLRDSLDDWLPFGVADRDEDLESV